MSDLLESVIDALAHLIGGSDVRQHTKLPKPVISKYDGFEIIDSRISKDDDELHIPDNLGDVPFWPMDARAGVCTDTFWLFKSIRTTSAKEWRGKVKMTPSRMIEICETGVYPTGETFSSVCPYGVMGGKLVELFVHNHPMAGIRVHPGDVYSRGSSFVDDIDKNTPLLDYQIGQAIELRREYLWSVVIGEEGIPRARFSTDPIGIREAFRLRDIPPGKARRAALRHWVREHWRKNRTTSAADRAFISAYLRGATLFTWDGLSCEIQPSRDDMRKNKR